MKLKLPWKPIVSGLRKAIGIASELTDNKWVDRADDLIEGLEQRLPNEPGQHKAEAFDAGMTAFIESDLAGLPPELQIEAQAILGDYRDDYVALRNVKERFEHSFDRLQAFVAKVKALRKPVLGPDAPDVPDLNS